MERRIRLILPSCNFLENEPDSLFEQCVKYIVLHLDILAVYDPLTCRFSLREGLKLPSEICDSLFDAYQGAGKDANDEFVHIFENSATSRLRRIRLKNSTITNDGLCLLLKHNLVELEISNCRNLTERSLVYLNEKAGSLKSLSLDSPVQMLPHCRCTEMTKNSKITVLEKNGFILRAPNLRKLSIHKLNICRPKTYYKHLLQPLAKLTHLDFSHCTNLNDLSCLIHLKCLTSLILFNVRPLFPEALASIKRLQSLRHLDVSQLSQKYGTFPNPNYTLAVLVEHLPNLMSLDISGTNLAGRGVAEHLRQESGECDITDIPGLSSRVENPFKFLGLFKTQYEACRRHDIPARYITGDANEEQLLNAMVAYMDRPDILQRVLNNLYHLYQYENCFNVSIAMKLVLEAMARYLHEKQVQISGSASLYYLVQMKVQTSPFEVRMRNHIIRTIVNGMIVFKDDEVMIRNGCFTLCLFNIPEDVMFDYDRLVRIILHVLSEINQELGFLQRTALYLLNSLACQAEKSQKLYLGELGAVSHMLAIIKDRLEHQIFDDVLQIAWSTMWNVTDETAINCERFLDGDGMDLFLNCLSKSARRDELLRSMMGLLGNVAEVKNLRPRLMSEIYVKVFVELLKPPSDGIEVSYNAAGVLAHMCSDGPEAWTIQEPKRELVLFKMAIAIEGWNLSEERIINYRSFHPILGLLKVKHTPECQHWAAWALANLTKVYPKKYCSLVENDGGIPLLEEVITSETAYPRIKQLAEMVINNFKQHKMKNL